MSDFADVHLNVHQNVRLDVGFRRKRRGGHLLNRDGYWIFQRRVPAEFAGSQCIFRFGLGRISEPHAESIVRLLNDRIDHLVSVKRLAIIGAIESIEGVIQMVAETSDERKAGIYVGECRSMRYFIDLAQRPIPDLTDDLRLFAQVCRETLQRSSEISRLPATSPVARLGKSYLDELWHRLDTMHEERQRVRQQTAEQFQQSWDNLQSGDFSVPPAVSDQVVLPNDRCSEPVHRDVASASSGLPAKDIGPACKMLPDQNALPALQTVDVHSGQQSASLKASADNQATIDAHFSVALENYLSQRRQQSAHFADSCVANPARLWIAIVGDHPMTDYFQRDIQHFINQISRLPPNWSKKPALAGKSVAEIIAANGDGRYGYPKLKTVRESFIGNLKGLFSHHFGSFGQTSPLAMSKPTYPKFLEGPTAHDRPSAEIIAAAFILGSRSSNSIDYWLPALLNSTGRRLGLLVHLQPGSFFQRDGVWMAKVEKTVALGSGGVKHVPFKTDESITEFVVCEQLVRARFIDWARSRKTDFIFQCAHKQGRDASDYASKQIARLLRDAAALVNSSRPPDAQLCAGTAHGFRGRMLDRVAEAGLQNVVGDLQVGHGRDAVDRSYRRLTDIHVRRIYEMRDDPMIDYSVLSAEVSNRLDSAR